MLNVKKVGSGNWSLTGNSTASLLSTLTLAGGSVSLSGAGSLAFATYYLQRGTLLLDNTTQAANNRLGGPTLMGANNTTLTPQGGELWLTGNASTPVSETIATLTPGDGGGVVTLRTNAAKFDQQPAATRGQSGSLSSVHRHGFR